MHYLEKEFERLIKYTQGLGVKVSFVDDASIDMSAAWTTDGSEIEIFNRKRKGPLLLCLEIIHELAHHLTWVHNGRGGDLNTNRILAKEMAGKTLTKKQRKVIFDMEAHDSQFQKIIHKEINSKIPIKRLEREIALDLWIYEYFYKKGIWPKIKDRKQKIKELRKIYV